jgi:hypothetical protein
LIMDIKASLSWVWSLQENRKCLSSSTIISVHRVQILSCQGIPLYLPVSLANLWAEILNLVKVLLCMLLGFLQ